MTFQIGANGGQQLGVQIGDMSAVALFGAEKTGESGETTEMSDIKGKIDVTGFVDDDGKVVASKFDTQLGIIDDAVEKVSSTRSELGAIQNSLEHTINSLGASSENLTAAESRIRDGDMAKEMMDFTKNNILTQASQAMLAQANQMPQGVLQLLQSYVLK